MKPTSPLLRPMMFAGTGSDVGKSVIAAAFCRIFLQDGYRPAPFKAQNMALNSFVTADGLELGRAQAVQAVPYGYEPAPAQTVGRLHLSGRVARTPHRQSGCTIVLPQRRTCGAGA